MTRRALPAAHGRTTLRPSARIAPILAALVALPMVLGGCAFLNRDNTPTLNAVEKHLWPESTAKKAIAFPVLFPVSVGATVIDAVIVHPATVVDDAARDAKEGLWGDLDWDKEYVTACTSLPWRGAMTPVVFAGAFLGRSMFDVPDQAQKQRERDRATKALDEAKALFDPVAPVAAASRDDKTSAAAAAGYPASISPENAEKAVMVLRDIPVQHLKPEQQRLYRVMMLRAAWASRRFEVFDSFAIEMDPEKSLADPEVEAMLAEMRASDDPNARWAAVSLASRSVDWRAPRRTRPLTEALADPNTVVRYRALEELRWVASAPVPAEVEAAIRRVGENDADPVNRAIARGLLRMNKENSARAGKAPVR